MTFGSPGVGRSGHLAAAQCEQAANANMRQIPYAGAAAALVDVIAGRLDCFFAALPSAIGAIKVGQMRAVAMGSERRSSLAPDSPPIAESSYAGYDALTVLPRRSRPGK